MEGSYKMFKNSGYVHFISFPQIGQNIIQGQVGEQFFKLDTEGEVSVILCQVYPILLIGQTKSVSFDLVYHFIFFLF